MRQSGNLRLRPRTRLFHLEGVLREFPKPLIRYEFRGKTHLAMAPWRETVKKRLRGLVFHGCSTSEYVGESQEGVHAQRKDGNSKQASATDHW